MADNRRSDILFAAAIVVLGAIAWHIRDVLLLIYVAALFAVIVGPAITNKQTKQNKNKHPSRGIAVISLFFCVVLTLTSLLVFLTAPILRDMLSFSAELP